MKMLIKAILDKFNLTILKKSTFEKIYADSVRRDSWEHDLEFTMLVGHEVGDDFLRLMSLSKAQIRQDIFALKALNFKRNGFFVEFGATDGISLSNTYLLEKEFGFTGILAEPNPHQRDKIALIRDAIIEDKCVWNKSGVKLEFIDAGDLSTISEFSETDKHAGSRANRHKFQVETISLTDMLIKHAAPQCVDYLSIDTEGSEFEILSNHDFEKYWFSVITVEHNYSPQREEIYELLTSSGYIRVMETVSRQDDWYVKA